MANIALICGDETDPVSVYTTAVVARALDGKKTEGKAADQLWRESVEKASQHPPNPTDVYGERE